MKLSICMMVKNEEKNLERCLNSLEPLRKAIDSELIIVDTGSSDGTVEIAKHYTDSVYFHAWNNNFSEMRNITINYATGDWILIIDADEELVEASGIIEFFHSKKFKNYTAAAIKVENVVTKLGKVSSKVTSFRIFKRTPELRYEGAVHNMPHFKGVALEINSTIKHYGYMSDDIDLMERKFNRTSTLLLNEIEKDPSNLYYRYQLGISYSMYGDFDKAKEALKEAYISLMESNCSVTDYIYIVGAYAKILTSMDDCVEAIAVCDVGLKVMPDYIDLKYFKGVCSIKLEKFEEGIKEIQYYLSDLQDIENSRVYSNTSIQLYTLLLEDEARFNMGQALYRIGEYNKAKNQFKIILSKGKIESEYFNFAIFQYIKNCALSKSVEEIPFVYDILSRDKWKELDKVVYEVLFDSNEDECDYVSYVKILATFKSDIGLIFDDVYKLYVLNQEIIIDSESYTALFKEYNFSEIIYIFIKLHYNVFNLLILKSELEVMKHLGTLDSRFDDFDKIVLENLNFYFEESNPKYFNILRQLSKYLVIQEMQNSNNLELFDQYIKWGFSYIHYKYNIDYIENYHLEELASSEEQYLISLWQVINKNNRNALENAVNIFPEWNKIMSLWLEKEIGCNNNDELEELSITVKNNIRLLIQSQKYFEANKLIDEYLKMFPNDIEVIGYQSELLGHYRH